MFRLPVKCRMHSSWIRFKSSSSFIRSTFIDYFVSQHGHKHVKSSSVLPLFDPTVPFVNAGMNQFKGVFLGNVDPPYPRVVNSQKCVRVGGKHNDLDVVGTDGHHHTFFEMLGNWSFGDYYKKEACQMAWDLLLGPYRLKPENLVVTYFSGDAVIGLPEDKECRDIWKQIGVPESRLRGLGAADNFWEMGVTGPCGPCTEIHYVHPDGTLTEIWNLVFIQCNRESNGSVSALRRQHVDTGLGLERAAALLQGVPTNYHTDLFQPIIQAIHKNSKGTPAYSHRYGPEATLDTAYRRLADHARMVAVCLADGAFPAANLNLKQVMRKSFKISTDVFHNPRLLACLYDEVMNTLGTTYPELETKEKDAKVIIEHEMQAYEKMRAGLAKKWRDLVKQYPEVEVLSDVELGGFALGYKEFKETVSKQNATVIPGDLVFKLYDTHGFQEELIERIAKLNSLEIDKKEFWKLLSQHKSRHKTAFKEQSSNKGLLFDQTIEKLIKSGTTSTNDSHKYEYLVIDNKIQFEPLKTNVVAILNEDCEWIDYLEPCESRPYYLVTKDTNFYCEEGGQIADRGIIRLNKDVALKVDSVFKIRGFVFHKGYFEANKGGDCNYINYKSDVSLEIDSARRLNIMRNHTGVHLLNAAIKQVLPNSVVCQIGSGVTEKGLYLNLSVYGEKLSQDVVLQAQELIRQSIQANAHVETRLVEDPQVVETELVTTVPGQVYPESGLRLVGVKAPLLSKELCCGTHVPSTGIIEDFCITNVKGAGGNTPTIHALTGDAAKQVRELFCRAEKLEQVIDLVSSERREEEISRIKQQLLELCGSTGAPYGEHAHCLARVNTLLKRDVNKNEMALQAIAEAEVREVFAEAQNAGRNFVVHFLRCSYLMQADGLAQALAAGGALTAGGAPDDGTQAPSLLLGCAGGNILATCRVPQGMVNSSFCAERWLGCVAAVFGSKLRTTAGIEPTLYAEMTAAKVSLINCEQLVQDAMLVAIKYAQAHIKHNGHSSDTRGQNSKNRQHN
ncbi:alanine--tRNA ligase, mitochondrial [Achroia grisella]|uniref:alanine--tRNA ligase, mitochondrial n=1 Tax=Achroia grisella TaxID=688607 RepID=UPI0027D2270C|nr:alanine--tRNA ligase, mitochondrial [Achroia grisella]